MLGQSRPVVAQIEPNTSSSSGGTPVAINGENLTEAIAVKFGTADAASFEVASDSEIVAVAPPGVGIVDVTVETPEGTSLASPADQLSYSATVAASAPRTVGGNAEWGLAMAVD